MAKVQIGYDAGAVGGKTLYDKLFEAHTVSSEPDGTVLLYIDRHLVHEVTSPQAFEGLRNAGRGVRRPDCTLTTVDHNVPTAPRQGHDMADMASNGFIKEPDSLKQVLTLEEHVREFGLEYYGMDDARQGIVHVIGPEQGFTLPGTTVVCGDSHTATHGAFGALAFGIGTSEVEHVLATQTLLQRKSKNMRINVNGTLPEHTKSKDLMLHIIGVIGTAGGTGYVIEFAGDAIRALSVEARMSICNMAIEAGAKAGIIAPDETTIEYFRGRPMAPTGDSWARAVEHWKTLPSDADAKFDREVAITAADVIPTVTWGTSPQDVVAIDGVVPDPMQEENLSRRAAMERSLEYMGLVPNTPMTKIPIDKVFIGSCTNSRIEDLRSAAAVASGRTVAKTVKAAMVVPGSGIVRNQAVAEGLDKIFIAAGFDWREPGCSMCLGMNPDQLSPEERCAATSNRNFEGRQGKGGRTHLMSPSMAAAAAVTGFLADVRELSKEAVDLEAVTGQKARDAREFLAGGAEAAAIPAGSAAAKPAGAGAAVAAPGGAAGIPKFVILEGLAAPIDMENVDTDKIIPKQFLKTVKRSGLGSGAFFEVRYNVDGSENPDFVLNQVPYKGATRVLVTGDNFGCGSSREHAPWALLDLGIRCIISTTIAEIFRNNCFKNGMLPIDLPKSDVDSLMAAAREKRSFSVDLAAQTITVSGDGAPAQISFEVDAFRKHCLLNGFDDIGLTLQKVESISKFETGRSLKTPWLDGTDYKPK